MSVQIQVFAVLKDYFKTEFEFSSPIASIQELKMEMEKMNPASKKILQACRFAVNDEFVTPEYKLNEHDKVVVLPPSSGG